MSLTEREEIELINLIEIDQALDIPPKLYPIYDYYRYKMIYGGRGSAKSWSVAKFFIEKLTKEKKKLLCTREIQDSLEDSVYELLWDTIHRLDAPGWIKRSNELRNTITGSKISFKGLKDLRAAQSLKSYEGYDYCWVEEAQAVAMDSWKILTPTIRKKGSEIWATFNRYSELDPVFQKFCIKKRENTLVVEINWRDNPWFPPDLRDDMKVDREDDYDLYLHVWEGHPISQVEKAVIPRDLVHDAMQRQLSPVNCLPVVGADIARFGGDRIVFYKRIDLKIVDTYVRKRQSTTDTARDLAAFAGSEYATILIDDTGVGGGVTDVIRDMGFKNVVPINFGSSPKDKSKYDSIISEMWFETREALRDADIPDDTELAQELTGRLFSYDKSQRRCVEPKKKFKERYTRSPDKADALLLCFYSPGVSIELPNEIKKQVAERKTKIQRRKKGRLIT
jgi:phage terminase large subunit